MHFLEKIIGFYNSGKHNWALLLALSWLFWPGSFYLVGVIFESRLAPVWQHQSKAFLPGDLVFGIIFVCLVSMLARVDSGNASYHNAPILFLLQIFIANVAIHAHQIDILSYPTRSQYSPTKIWHNVVGFFIIPVVLIWLSVILINALAKSDTKYWAIFLAQRWGIIVVCMIFYFACVAIDVKNGCTGTEAIMRHPDDWKPIWISLKSR